MSSEALSLEEQSTLKNLLGNSSNSVKELRVIFTQYFGVKRHNHVLHYLNTLSNNISPETDGIMTLSILAVIQILIDNGCVNGKITFYKILIKIEKMIKKDLYKQEQFKYYTKELKEQKKVTEAQSSDLYRVHSCVKVFAFKLLLKLVDESLALTSFLTVTLESIENELQSFEHNHEQLRSMIAEYASLTDSFKQMCSKANVCLENSAKINHECEFDNSVLTATPVQVKLPCLPVQLGELYYALSTDKNELLWCDIARKT